MRLGDPRADDGLTYVQAMEVISGYGRMDVPMDKDTWLRTSTRAIGGYPLPARHNGYFPCGRRPTSESSPALTSALRVPPRNHGR
ncbi:hypothetical protein J2S43_000969 [Catenuloplanes nepalensis]|uniref:Uncharacterized protein n=1 Tax=Catenuloplanes nepalensis TaxID=587533 RepID=A0ABT9MM04_9ACTN|nr:hypothetical protein [Catenuloplanes nepalensis]